MWLASLRFLDSVLARLRCIRPRKPPQGELDKLGVRRKAAS
jgi:hypothetical protein